MRSRVGKRRGPPGDLRTLAAPLPGCIPASSSMPRPGFPWPRPPYGHNWGQEGGRRLSINNRLKPAVVSAGAPRSHAPGRGLTDRRRRPASTAGPPMGSGGSEMDKLLAMRTFRRVVELGGFSAAARDLDMSNAGVSKPTGSRGSAGSSSSTRRRTRSGRRRCGSRAPCRRSSRYAMDGCERDRGLGPAVLVTLAEFRARVATLVSTPVIASDQGERSRSIPNSPSSRSVDLIEFSNVCEGEHLRKGFWRRRRDSNPRYPLQGTTI